MREAQIKQGDDGPLKIEPEGVYPDRFYPYFIWADGVIYYTIKDVDGKARVILDRALEVWNNEVESPKFQFDDAHRPDSVVFKLGTWNRCDQRGYKPGKENYI